MITLKKIGNIEIRLTAEPDWDPDLSWDEDGSTRDALESGLFIAFDAKVSVLRKGVEIGADYLGGCIYESLDDFAQGADPKNAWYCRDMMHEAIQQARKWAA
jgi:hypothetical protein